MRPARIALGLCLLALGVRIAALLALGRAHHPDLWESEEIATNLLAGRGFVFQFLGTSYRSYMEPLYPGLCAAVYALTGHSFLALGLVQAVLGTALVGLVFACAWKLGGERAGALAGALAAVHPGLVVYTTKFHPFILDSLLVLAVVAACLFFSERRPWRSALLLGAALGLCALTRATILVCLPVMAWFLWPRARGKALALSLATAAVVVAPWVGRNLAVHHRFVFTRSGTALVFWLGNNPHAFSGSAAAPDGTPLYALIPEEERQRLSRLDELGQQDLFRAEATAYVRAQPLAFLRRWAVKLGYFWWQSPQAGRLYPAAWFRLYQAFYLAIAGLALAAMVVHRRRRETWLVVGVCLSIALVQSAYYVEGRHRLTIEPLLILLAAQALAQLLPWGKKVSS
jgi:4-amino-4-deoxy-L-arabinose transferase-like glycosyltransferase